MNSTISVSEWIMLSNDYLFVAENSTNVKVFATVMKGYFPVVHATVTATVRGTASSDVITLRDDGLGPDITKEDGIYSGFILSTSSVGKYTVVVDVVGGDESAVRTTRVESQAARIIGLLCTY